MKRPCGCDNCPIGEPWVRQRDCRDCWLYWNDPRYRRLWTDPADRPRAAKPAAKGPGTELKKLLAELGITNFAGCSCDAKAAQMDAWGVEGCRSNFETIRSWIAEAQEKASWTTTISAAIRAATTQTAFEIDSTDVAGSLVRIAIRRGAGRTIEFAFTSALCCSRNLPQE